MKCFRIMPLALALSTVVGFSVATAQQENPLQPTSPAQQQDDNLPGQQAAGQDADSQARPALGIDERDRANQPDQYETRKVVADSHTSQRQTVKDVLVKKLMKANEAELELAQMAQQKTDNEELRQFTQTLIQDHQGLKQKLQQVSGKDGHAQSDRASLNARSRTQPGTQTPGSNRAESGIQEPNRREASTQIQEQNELGRQTPATPRGQGVTQAQDRQDRTNAFAGNQSEQSNYVPQELCKVMEKAADNSLQMTKEMLQKYEGQDFQMGFLGQQIVAHTQMIAHLKAIESDGPDELQEITREALTKTEQHLKKAKELANKFEDKEKPAQQVRR